MKLHPKKCLIKLQFLHRNILFQAPKRDQVFIIVLRLPHENSFSVNFITENKKYYVITYVLDFESQLRAPQGFESPSNSLHIQSRVSEKLHCNYTSRPPPPSISLDLYEDPSSSNRESRSHNPTKFSMTQQKPTEPTHSRLK